MVNRTGFRTCAAAGPRSRRLMRRLERRLVGEPAAAEAAAAATGRPGVVGRRAGAAALGAAAAAPLVAVASAPLAAALAAVAATAAEATALAALALHLGHLGGGAAQSGADLVDVDLENGALLAFLGLERALLEPALHDDAHAALKALGDVLRVLPPHGAGEEHRLAVAPLAALPVEYARSRGHTEVGDRGTARGESQFRVVDEVADERDLGFACHGSAPGCVVGSGVRARNANAAGAGGRGPSAQRGAGPSCAGRPR